MKLYYFDAPGRAEPVRLTFKVGGVDFEDVRFGRDEWMSKYKPMSPTGQCPFLELDDGSYLCQSAALYLYAGEKAALLPNDAVTRARAVEMLMTFEAAMLPLINTMSIQDADEKLSARKKLLATDGAVATGLQTVDKLLGASKTKFYLTDDVGMVDLCAFVNICMLKCGQLDGVEKDDIMKYSNLAATWKKVAEHPKVNAVYKDAGDRFRAYRPE